MATPPRAEALPPLSRGALRSIAAGGALQQPLVLRLHALDALPGDVYGARVSDDDTTVSTVLLDAALTPLAESGALRRGMTLVVHKCVACARRGAALN
jgi:hypothetical protein